MTAQAWEHWTAMVLAARPVVGSMDDARDCASEAITQYLERHPEDVRNLQALLVTIAKRRALDHVRAQVRARARDARVATQVSLDAPDVAEEIVGRAEARWVDAEARRLLSPTVYRLLLMVADGVPMQEIAEQLGMTERAAQSHLLRARRVVRSALARTLAGLGLAAATARRWLTPATATATVLAAALALGISAPLDETQAPRMIVLPERSDLAAPGSARTARGGHTSEVVQAEAAAVRPTLRRTRSVEQVAGVSTGVVGARVEKRDDGRRSQSVVEQVQHCLENLRVTTHYLGCEEQEPEPS